MDTDNDTIDAKLPNKLRAKFFKDDMGKPYVEIAIVGDPNTLIRKVSPEDATRFPREWAAFEQGESEVKVDGTPLTEIPGVDRDASLSLRLKGIRTVEEMAGLDEGAAKALGMGGLTFWKAAKLLLRAQEAERMAAAIADAPKRDRLPKNETTEVQ